MGVPMKSGLLADAADAEPMLQRALRLIRRHENALRGLGVLAAGAGGAWSAFLATPGFRFAPWSLPYGFTVGLLLLLFGLLLVRVRTHGVLLLAGWYGVATSAIPCIWARYYGAGMLPGGGSLEGAGAWVLLVAMLSLPAYLVPAAWVRRVPAAGVLLSMLLAAVPPLGLFGMATPWLTAGALLPGVGGFWHGWIALALLVALMVSVGLVRNEDRIGKLVFLLGVALFGVSIVLGVRAPAPQLAAGAGGPGHWRIWAMQEHLGEVPDADQHFDAYYAFEKDLRAQVRAALDEGARLIVTPEGMDPHWNAGEALEWSDVAALARQRHATVLLGIYRPLPRTAPGPADWQDGLLDLGSGAFYPDRIAQPISMWRPWAAASIGSFPLNTSRHSMIETPYGRAAYLLCYEELLVWPVAGQMLPWRAAHPKLLISAANQWFVNGPHSWLGRTQSRSVRMQALLWNLPLLRSANWAAPQ